jgi:uncharacterized protein YukE
MLRGAISIAAIGVFSLATLAPVVAQDSAKKDQNSNPPPASTTAPTATGNQPASTDKKDSSTSTPAEKPKKVWTNDDMGNLDHHGDVSVVGKRPTPQNTYNGRYSPPPGQSESMVKYYRQQIDNLQQQSDSIDKQISNLQDAKNGKTVDSTRTYNPWGGVQGDWNAQIAQLQKNKDNIQKQIDSIEEQIRKVNP